MAGVAVMVCAGTVVVAAFAFVTLGLAAVDVTVIGGTGVGNAIASSESRDARSHFTRKCKTGVDHEVVMDGARFSYQVSASKPDRQFR